MTFIKCPINHGAMQSYLALSYILTHVLGAGQEEHFIIQTIDGAVYPFVYNPVKIKQNKTKSKLDVVNQFCVLETGGKNYKIHDKSE